MTETLGMIVHRLKFKTCKVVEVYWIFVGLCETFMGSIFCLVTLYYEMVNLNYRHQQPPAIWHL